MIRRSFDRSTSDSESDVIVRVSTLAGYAKIEEYARIEIALIAKRFLQEFDDLQKSNIALTAKRHEFD
jgi:hypothetical protein